MTIKRGGTAEPISGRIHTREIPSHCPRCKIRNNDTILKPRLDYFMADKDQWLQCYHCGLVVPKHDIPQQGSLTTDIEPITSKFNIRKESEHWEPPKHRRGFNERLDTKQGEIADEDVKRELKKGGKLISYSET